MGLAAIWWAALRTIRRQRRELTEYLRRIEQSNEDLDAFAARIAHDLRNHLAPLALAPAVLRSAPDAAALQRLADGTERSVRQSRALLDGLLAFSRAGRADESESATAVAPAVRDTVDTLTALAARVGADLRLELEDVRVACPPTLLRAALTNVVGNALKFLQGRSVRQVTVAAGPRGPWAEIRVEDTGPGIPAEAIPRITEPFYRVPGSTAPGSGIGLATVRRILEAYGGELRVDSTVGRGSVFRLRFPRADGTTDAGRPESVEPPAAPAA
jgi:signal transduction histidine kinase